MALTVADPGATAAPATKPAAITTEPPQPAGQTAPNDPLEIGLAEIGLEEAPAPVPGEATPPEGDGEEPTDLSNQPEPPDAAEGSEQSDEPAEPAAETPAAEPDDEGETPPANVPYKRLAKEVSKRKQLEATLAETRKKLEEVTTAKSVPVPADPVEATPEIVSLNEQVERERGEINVARQLIRKLNEDPDAVIATLSKANATGWTGGNADQARDWLENYIEGQREKVMHLGARLEGVRANRRDAVSRARAEWDAAAEKHFTWAHDDEDARTKMAEQILQARPWMKQDWFGKFAALAVAKEIARYNASLAQTAPAAQPAARRVVPSAGSGRGGPARPAQKLTPRQEAERRFVQSPPTEDSMLEYIAASLTSPA